MIRSSIVIPTLNERENILILLDRIAASGLRDYEVIVADENSPDGTAAAVEAYAGDGHPEVRVVRNDGIPGLSPSIVKGFHAARGRFLCCMDGDLQHDVADLAGVLNTLEESDFVIGSRYAPGGGFRQRWNPCRVVISRTATALARMLLGVKVLDPMSGFFAIRREVFEKVATKLSPRGFKIMLELLYLIRHEPGENYRVREYGITFGIRMHGRSKLSLRVIRQYLRMLYELRRSRQA